MSRKRKIACLTLAAASLVAGMSLQGLEVAAHGNSQCRIVIAENAIPAEKTAAAELQKYIEKISGATVPVVNTPSEEQSNIFVGISPESDVLLADYPELKEILKKDDAILLKNFGKDLLICGDRPRGTLYAVYTLLEDYWGVQFWSPVEEDVPVQDTLTVPDDLSFCYAPKMFSRESHYYEVNYHPQFPAFAAKLKSNGHFQVIPEEWGGHVKLDGPGGFCHSFLAILPAKVYFEQHPEWYALGENGKRTSEQPCWTNKEMQQELLKQTLDYLRKNPGVKIFSISQMDGWVRCLCENCAKVEADTGSPAGPVLDAVNFIASEIEDEFPEVVIETLAYVYSQKPPMNGTVHPNVLIRLCPYLCDFHQPYSSDANAEFRDDMLGWRKLANRLGIWDYNANFSNYHIPHPNMRNFGENMRFFADNNVEFVFAQGDIGSSNCGEFIQMRAWVMAHLLWNAYQDYDELRKEFLHGYYSPGAGEKLFQVIELIDSEFTRSGKKLGCYHPTANDWLTLDTLQKVMELFQEAEREIASLAAEDQEKYLERLRRAQIPYDVAYLCNPENTKWNKALSKKQLQDLDDLWAEVQMLMKKSNVVDYNELTKVPFFYELVSRHIAGPELLKRSGDVPEFCKDLDDNEWYEFSGDDFNLLQPGVKNIRVEDATSPYKFAIKMPNNHLSWAFLYDFPPMLSKQFAGADNNWSVWVSVRGEGRNPDAEAVWLGVYEGNKDIDHQHRLKLSEVSGDYRWIKLADFSMDKGVRFYMAPTINEELDAVYIDRMILVHNR